MSKHNGSTGKVYDSLIRVSRMGGREESAESTMTITDQQRANERAAKDAGGRIGETIKALDQSGHTVTESKEWQRALARCQRGESNGIIVAYGDRLTRNWRKVGRFYDDLESAGAEVIISAMPGIDYRTPEGRAQTGMIAVMSDMQYGAAKVRGDNIKNAQLERGVLNVVPYGYMRNEQPDDTRVDPTADPKALVERQPDADVVRAIFEQRAQGSSWGMLVEWLHDENIKSPKGNEWWAHATLAGIIRNEAYLGMVVYGRKNRRRGSNASAPEADWVRIKNAHPALVTNTMWKDAQGRGVKITRTGHMVGGIAAQVVRCGSCGESMSVVASVRRQDGTKRMSYTCRYGAGKGCDARRAITKTRTDDWLDAQIRDVLAGSSLDIVVSARDVETAREVWVAAQAETEAYIMHTPATSKHYAAGLRAREQAEANALLDYEDKADTAEDAGGLPASGAAWDALSLAGKRGVVRHLVDHVVVGAPVGKGRNTPVEDRLTIVWRHSG